MLSSIYKSVTGKTVSAEVRLPKMISFKFNEDPTKKGLQKFIEDYLLTDRTRREAIVHTYEDLEIHYTDLRRVGFGWNLVKIYYLRLNGYGYIGFLKLPSDTIISYGGEITNLGNTPHLFHFTPFYGSENIRKVANIILFNEPVSRYLVPLFSVLKDEIPPNTPNLEEDRTIYVRLLSLIKECRNGEDFTLEDSYMFCRDFVHNGVEIDSYEEWIANRTLDEILGMMCNANTEKVPVLKNYISYHFGSLENLWEFVFPNSEVLDPMILNGVLRTFILVNNTPERIRTMVKPSAISSVEASVKKAASLIRRKFANYFDIEDVDKEILNRNLKMKIFSSVMPENIARETTDMLLEKERPAFPIGELGMSLKGVRKLNTTRANKRRTKNSVQAVNYTNKAQNRFRKIAPVDIGAGTGLSRKRKYTRKSR